MNNSRKKYIDPVHGWIYINVDNVNVFEEKDKAKINALLLDVVNSDVFQRLLNIKQLGDLHSIFPGATHTRFLHSLGVFHMAKKVLLLSHVSWSKEEAILLLLGALLHDVGHGPLSHVYESFFRELKGADYSHEGKTKLLIKEHLGKLIVNAFGKDMLGKLLDIFSESKKGRVVKVLSNQVDIDRLDYLIRDAYFSGTGIRFAESEWLFSNMHMDKNGPLCFNTTAADTLFTLLTIRYQMHSSIYNHEDLVKKESILVFIARWIQVRKKESKEMEKLCREIMSYHNEGWLQWNDYSFISLLRKYLKKDSILRMLLHEYNCLEQIEILPLGGPTKYKPLKIQQKRVVFLNKFEKKKTNIYKNGTPPFIFKNEESTSVGKQLEIVKTEELKEFDKWLSAKNSGQIMVKLELKHE